MVYTHENIQYNLINFLNLLIDMGSLRRTDFNRSVIYANECERNDIRKLQLSGRFRYVTSLFWFNACFNTFFR